MAAAVPGDAGAVSQLRCIRAKVRSKRLAEVGTPHTCSGPGLRVSMPRKAAQTLFLSLMPSFCLTAAVIMT